jgi:acid phosphatase
MDKFVAYSSNPGYVLSQYDATNLPEGKIAQHYTMLDNMYHSAFGGSFLNHQWLICACTPVWNQTPPNYTTDGTSGGVVTLANTFASVFDPNTKNFKDNNVTLIPTPQTTIGPSTTGGMQSSGTYYVVNTTQTQNEPHRFTAAAGLDQYLNPITGVTTIGDELKSANISWRWYSGGWNSAITNGDQATTTSCGPGSGNNFSQADQSGTVFGGCFQFHHQPFNYYASFGSKNPVACGPAPSTTQFLCDENDFLNTDLAGNSLPAVSFIKPVGINNDHPNYASVVAGQQHVQQIIAAICASKYWNNTAVIITYDENGGRWDHVVPPKIDQWGPGTRVPGIVISPYARAGFVDHTQYETVSIISLIEKLFNLPALPTSSSGRDLKANPFFNAFNFTQTPLACQSS